MKKLLIIIIIFILAVPQGHAQVPEEYLKIAAENNPGLKASLREFEAALERIPQAKGLPNPTLMAAYSVWPSETMPGMVKATVSLSQMFPWFGTLKARGDEAALIAEARYEVFIDQRNNLFYQLAEAWYPLYELNRFRKIEQGNISILNSWKNIATRNFQSGTGPMVDVLRADVMLQEAQTRLSVLDDRETLLLAVFNNLLNRSTDEAVTVPDSLYTKIEVSAFNPDSVLSNNSRLRELNYRYEASEVKREVARKQGLPGIGIGLEYMNMGNPAGMTSPDMKKGALMPMVTLSLPIYRKQYNAAQKEARLMQESIALQRENTLNMLSSDYNRALTEIRQQQKMIELFSRQVTTLHQSLNLLFKSYSNSGNNFEEVLRMQQQLLQYEKDKASAEVILLTAQARIQYLTGNTIYSNENR